MQWTGRDGASDKHQIRAREKYSEQKNVETKQKMITGWKDGTSLCDYIYGISTKVLAIARTDTHTHTRTHQHTKPHKYGCSHLTAECVWQTIILPFCLPINSLSYSYKQTHMHESTITNLFVSTSFIRWSCFCHRCYSYCYCCSFG